MSHQVVGLKMENFKRIEAVDLKLDDHGNIVLLTGANAQGKSSIIDGVMAALVGPTGTKAITRPIRDGEDQASVFVDLGDFTVERTWKAGKTALTVLSKFGAKQKSAQTFLDSLLGALTFDPLAFTQMDAKKRITTLVSFLDLPFDPDELEGRRAATFDQRTEIGREVTKLKGQLAGLQEVKPPEEPELGASEAVEAYQAAQEAHTAYDATFQRHQAAKTTVERLRVELEEAERAEKMLKFKLDTDEPALPDLDGLKERLDGLEAHNLALREQNAAAVKWTETKGALAAAQAKYDGYTADLDAIAGEKSNALAAATMPIEGLSFDESDLLYQDVPFSQASSAEQLRVSLAMGMAMNPEIRIMFIRDGSLLDSTNMELVTQMAEAADFQVWIERVDESGEVGFVIVDGNVAQ